MNGYRLIEAEAKRLEQVAGTSFYGTVYLQSDGEGHTEIHDDTGIPAYLDENPETIIGKIRVKRKKMKMKCVRWSL